MFVQNGMLVCRKEGDMFFFLQLIFNPSFSLRLDFSIDFLANHYNIFILYECSGWTLFVIILENGWVRYTEKRSFDR